MKIFYTLILYLFVLSAFSQTKEENVNTSGTYLFQKATFTVYNYDAKSEVDNRVITDPSLLNGSDLFFRNVFVQANISNGVLASCVLSDNSEYGVKDEIVLTPAKVLPSSDENNQDEFGGNNNSMQLAPYVLSIHDNVLTFTVSYLYGDSKYNFPLEGKLIVTLTKQK